MVDRLTGVRALVENEAVAGPGDAPLAGHGVGGGEDATEEVIVVKLGDGLDVAPGNDQEVDRRLGVEVGEGDHLIVSKEGLEFGVGDEPAEDAVRLLHSSQSSESTAMKASWGISTEPTRFIRFLPSFCFSSSFRLRVMSPP